jgi:hypothetical protein
MHPRANRHDAHPVKRLHHHVKGYVIDRHHHGYGFSGAADGLIS